MPRGNFRRSAGRDRTRAEAAHAQQSIIKNDCSRHADVDGEFCWNFHDMKSAGKDFIGERRTFGAKEVGGS